MKFRLGLILSVLLCHSSPVFANLGESFAQINARYGKPVRKLPDSLIHDSAQSVYRYEFNGRKIYITFMEAKSVSEAIRAPEQAPRFSDKMCLAMAAQISGQSNWTEASRDAGGIFWVTGGLTAILQKNTATPDFFSVSTLKFDAHAAMAERNIMSQRLGTDAAPGKIPSQGEPNGGSSPSATARKAADSSIFGDEIREAVAHGDLEKVKALVKANPTLVSSKNYGATLLHYAASTCKTDLVAFLLVSKADVNAKDDSEGTPLHEAAYKGCTEVAALLIANNADVNARDLMGETPLHRAATYGEPENTNVVAFLLAGHADINAKAMHGETPLHEAAGSGNKEVAAVLLANGANVNDRDEVGETPLHDAAMHGKKEMVEFLLANKADINAKDKFGRTPLRWAVEEKQNDLAVLLREHGGH